MKHSNAEYDSGFYREQMWQSWNAQKKVEEIGLKNCKKSIKSGKLTHERNCNLDVVTLWDICCENIKWRLKVNENIRAWSIYSEDSWY